MSSRRKQIALFYDRAHPELGGMERMIAEVGEALSRTHEVFIVAQRRHRRLYPRDVNGIRIVRHRIWEYARVRQRLSGCALAVGFGFTPNSMRAAFTIL